tara:strand:- start:2160 stop:2333 length:174 start_codon:yes stop_codon:yes gene_type:complete
MEQVITEGIPESLRHFVTENCLISAKSFEIFFGTDLQEPARSLPHHDQDMTSTLADF